MESYKYILPSFVMVILSLDIVFTNYQNEANSGQIFMTLHENAKHSDYTKKKEGY